MKKNEHKPNNYDELVNRGEAVVVGKSTLKLSAKIANYLNSNANVLLVGETGVGKSNLAKYVANQEMKNHTFIEISCADTPDSLFYPRIFGHEKGSFTGADTNRKGLFEEDDDDRVIFLDEIGDVGVRAYVALLRVLQERQYTPIGSDTSKKTNAKFIGGTIDKNNLRTDMKARFDVITIKPLRARRDEIPEIINHIMRMHHEKLNDIKIQIEAMALLMDHSWKNNFRGVQKVIRGVLYHLKDASSADKIIKIDMLPKSIRINYQRWIENEEANGIKSKHQDYFNECMKFDDDQFNAKSLRAYKKLSSITDFSGKVNIFKRKIGLVKTWFKVNGKPIPNRKVKKKEITYTEELLEELIGTFKKHSIEIMHPAQMSEVFLELNTRKQHEMLQRVLHLFNQKDLLRLYWKSHWDMGKTVKAVAATTHTDPSTVRRKIKDYGLKQRK